MLIDWLTLRTEITDIEEQSLYALLPYLATLHVTNALTDEIVKTKLVVDIDQVRSDFLGMVWSITSNGKDKYLNIGASPAFLKHGNNLFGLLDYQECKQIIISHADKVLRGALLLSENWQPRRIDITQNYYLQSHIQVKESLHLLRSCDGTRQKATVKGDSVYWGEKSSYRSGKAYDKYTQAVELNKKALSQKKAIPYTQEQLDLMTNVLRLEFKLGRQFFDEHEETILTDEFLINEHDTFFRKFIGDAKVTDMDKLLSILIEVSPSKGHAKAAYTTYLNIKQNGYEFTKSINSERTFYRHKKLLFLAGLSQADLTTAKIIPLRSRRLDMQPVYSWPHLAELMRNAA